MKKVFIIANFCGQLNGKDNNRFVYLASLLSIQHNCYVELITSDYVHEKKAKRDSIGEYPFKIVALHEPPYKSNVGVRRLYSHHSWGRNVYRYLKKSSIIPDVVYCAVPSLTAPNKAIKYCKKNNVKFVIDIQDLWPEAFRMAFNVPIISKLLFLPLELYANHIYKNACTICGVSKTYVQRGLKKNKKNADSYPVFIGTDLDFFDSISKLQPAFEREKNDICLCYCGTLGVSYDLECVFKAMKLLNDSKLRLIVMGDGPKRAEFENTATSLGIRVDFLGRLPYDKMCSSLKACDIAINPIVKRSVASIINKHADYAASGLPILNTQESKEYVDLIDEYAMGLSSQSGNPNELANNIYNLCNDTKRIYVMGLNARRCAQEKFDRKTTYDILASAILK